MSKHVVIIGAGPAGLTAALELVGQPGVQVTVLEADDCVGGISRTVNHNGNRIDIGGHRFFSKADWVMQGCISVAILSVLWLPRCPVTVSEPCHVQ